MSVVLGTEEVTMLVPVMLIALGCALLGVAFWLYRMISDDL
ncbi:MAG TPA: hypothetical protein VGX76_00150 [Pirellulales bacterium]|jgi:hypothetical protein|nr:hypothetical protein [Pirellulales bacterium]